MLPWHGDVVTRRMQRLERAAHMSVFVDEARYYSNSAGDDAREHASR